MLLLRVHFPYRSSYGFLRTRAPFTLGRASVSFLCSGPYSPAPHLLSSPPLLCPVWWGQNWSPLEFSAVSSASLLDSTSPHGPPTLATPSFPPSLALWFLGFAVSLPCSETLAVIASESSFQGAKSGWLFPVACTLSKAGCYHTPSTFPQSGAPLEGTWASSSDSAPLGCPAS